MLKRFRPYFSFLSEVKGRFLAGVAAGLLFAVFSGFGMPLMIKKVFPIIFGAKPEVEEVVTRLEGAIGEEEAAGMLQKAFPGEMDSYRETQEIRAWFDQKFGEERGRTILLVTAASLIPLTALLRGFAGFFNVYWVTSSGLHVLRRIQSSLFDKIQRLPLGFFSNKRTGDLISRLSSDAGILQAVVTTISNDLIKQPFTLLSALSYLIYESWGNRNSFFVLLCLLTIPVAVLPIRILGKRLMRRAGNMQKEAGSNTSILTETLGATREVRAFNLEGLMSERYQKGIARWTHLNLKVVKYRYFVPPVIEMLAAGAVAAALTYGATGGMSLSQFLPLVTALYMCYEPIKKLGEVHNRIKQGEASLDRLETILDADEAVADPPDPVELGDTRGELTFDGVDFAYGETPTLQGVDVSIPAGQIVALVGPSGAGKTTFASLVPRFFDPQGGCVRIDGVDLRKVRLRDLRDKITLVPQEAVLFSGSIRDNIALGRLGATDEQVREAARRANVDGFVEEFPEGYDTQVGERGAQLSGGQKQRISIARAFLKDAPVLVLDEATAALDSESESQIQKQLAELAVNRTTLIVAHRFSTIRIADRILVFDKGRIVGDGTFDELAENHALFKNLLARQAH